MGDSENKSIWRSNSIGVKYDPERCGEIKYGVDTITKYFNKIFNKRPRVIRGHTGKVGARFFDTLVAIKAEQFINNGFISDERKEEIYKKFENKYYEDGVYTISEKGVKYEGLWDDDMPDGISLSKINGKWLLEEFKDGFRLNYKELTEEEVKELKQKHNLK